MKGALRGVRAEVPEIRVGHGERWRLYQLGYPGLSSRGRDSNPHWTPLTVEVSVACAPGTREVCAPSRDQVGVRDSPANRAIAARAATGNRTSKYPFTCAPGGAYSVVTRDRARDQDGEGHVSALPIELHEPKLAAGLEPATTRSQIEVTLTYAPGTLWSC